MKASTRVRIGIGLIMLATVLGLIATWWWAINGMSSDVQTAWGVTCLLISFGGMMAAMSADL